jgi:hypothetical protein
MAKAVETSSCVLMCMSEKYKESPNCRAEAEYAFQLNKPIVPLYMQANYKADGWLGIILGSKIFVNFTKYDFDECMSRLRAELANALKTKLPVKASTAVTPSNHISIKISPATGTSSSSISTKNEAIEWSERKVESWMCDKNVNPTIRKNVLPCDGKILNQMYCMLESAPEFFYNSISNSASRENTVPAPTRDVALFAYELKILFKS